MQPFENFQKHFFKHSNLRKVNCVAYFVVLRREFKSLRVRSFNGLRFYISEYNGQAIKNLRKFRKTR
jgi:hypothetical protein